MQASNTAPRPPTDQAPRAPRRRGPGAVRSRCPRRWRSLAANTTYHFRISATNAGGTSKGSDQTFKTLPNPPTVVTEAASSVTQTAATPERDGEPQRRDGERMPLRIRHHDLLRIKRVVLVAAGVRRQARSRCPRRSRAWPRTRPTTSGSRRPTPAGPATAQTRRSKRCSNPPTVETKAASAVTQTSATPERHGEPQRRGSQRMQARIRRHDLLRIKRAVHPVAGVRKQPGRGVRVGHRPGREHHLPLQDLSDQRRRDEQRLRPDVQNAAGTPDGRNESGIGGHADLRDA